jgi:hypothetical protein
MVPCASMGASHLQCSWWPHPTLLAADDSLFLELFNPLRVLLGCSIANHMHTTQDPPPVQLMRIYDYNHPHKHLLLPGM